MVLGCVFLCKSCDTVTKPLLVYCIAGIYLCISTFIPFCVRLEFDLVKEVSVKS